MFTPPHQVYNITNDSPPDAPRKFKRKSRTAFKNNLSPLALNFNKKIDYDVLCIMTAFSALAFLWMIVLLYPESERSLTQSHERVVQ